MTFPNKVKLVEVGPRDGLQNEAEIVPTETKIELINRLAETGLRVIEATSFVSPKWIPQLADHETVFKGIQKKTDIQFPVLVPNLTGFDKALAAGVTEIAVFTTPSEQFSERNTNCSVAESIERIAAILLAAKKNNIKVRGYLSCVLGCPYEGKIAPQAVVDLAEKLFSLGCYEISLGDTIGIGTPLNAKKLIQAVTSKIPHENVAVHFHNTFGQALANIYAVLETGIHIIDSSVAGLGGCPYAEGASGNVASEDVLYMLNGMGITTGVNLDKLISVGHYISTVLKRENQSRVGKAGRLIHAGI